MASRSSMLNRPDVYSVLEIPSGAERISFDLDLKTPNCGVFTIYKEDHTLGNLLRMQLLRDEFVMFASYRVPHPLENKIEIRVQVTSESTPFAAFHAAVAALNNQATALAKSLRAQLDERNAGHAPQQRPATYASRYF